MGQYWNYEFLDYIKLFKNALNWADLKEYSLELKGPEFIEATLWRGENWYLIFLANYNYSIRRPFEEVIEEYFREFGYEILEKKFVNGDNDELNLDQCFKFNNKVYFIEQKIRDDHDSTKKRGQIENFEKKLNEMISKYGERNLVGIFYFIDPDLQKNKNYYKAELEKMSRDYGIELYLFYGVELFELLNKKDVWGEILNYLEQWKKEIPDFPETNFDIDAESSFEEIKDLSPSLYRKIFQDDVIFNEIVLTIFPEKKTLKLLLDYFKEKSSEKTIYKTIANLLEERLKD